MINNYIKIRFMDSFKFMSNSLSSLVNNLAEGLQIINAQIVRLVLNTYQPKMKY